MNEAEKQKYIDASEEDKKRYKREVSEMYENSKASSKSRKKRFLENAQRFEREADNLLLNAREHLDSKAMKEPSKVEKASKFDNGKNLSRTKPSHLPSFTVCIQILSIVFELIIVRYC